MATTAPKLEPDRREPAEHPALVTDPPESSRQARETYPVDPTQGSKIGSEPYDDPTQERKIGADPHDDPTRGRKIGADPYDDPTQGRRSAQIPTTTPPEADRA